MSIENLFATEEEIAERVRAENEELDEWYQTGWDRWGTIAGILRFAGWVPWNGDDCPVGHEEYPTILTADGQSYIGRAGDAQWVWNGEYPLLNVIAYQPDPRSSIR